jgi:hypothetical protein
MTRLEAFLGRENDYDSVYPEDIKTLRKGIKELDKLTDSQIEMLYREYSEECYCASWLSVSEGSLKDFDFWLNEDLKDGF